MLWHVKRQGLCLGLAALFFLILSGGIFQQGSRAEVSWQEIKGEHFIVYYPTAEDLELAQSVLREAEHYYDRIVE